MPILLVTSRCVSEDVSISAHVSCVHTVTARDQLHDTAQHRCLCVVCPSDAPTCLSEFARAFIKSPLDTLVSIDLPHIHAHKVSCSPCLRHSRCNRLEYKKHNVWMYPNHVYTWFRRPGPRVLNAYSVGPVSLVDEKVLRAADRNTSTYATENILAL